MNAPDARPENVARLAEVGLAIKNSLDFTTKQVIRFLESMVMQRYTCAGLIFDEQKPLVPRAKMFVYHPFQKHTLRSGYSFNALGWRRDLTGIEMAQKVAG